FSCFPHLRPYFPLSLRCFLVEIHRFSPRKPHFLLYQSCVSHYILFKRKSAVFTAVPIEIFYHSERSIAHYTLRARQCAYLFYFLNYLLYNNSKVNSNLAEKTMRIY